MIRQRMEAIYNSIAAEYARQNTMPPHLIELAARFLARLHAEANMLDVGCGDGLHMAWMETQGFHVTGIDISAGMLAQARTRVRGELLQMDMCHLTFPPASFVGIWCSASLLHLPKTQAAHALRQMHHVLVPGGTLFLGLQGGEGEGWEVTRFGIERFFARYTVSEVEALLSQTGFTLDECHRDATAPGRWINSIARATQ